MIQHCNLKDKSNDKEDVVENQVKEGRLKQEEKGKVRKIFFLTRQLTCEKYPAVYKHLITKAYTVSLNTRNNVFKTMDQPPYGFVY